MKRIEYKVGQEIGGNGVVYVEERPTKNMRRALFRCKCGEKFEARISDVKNGVTKSCGCYQRLVSSKRNTTHGLHNHPLYPTWNGIKQRCYNPKDKGYTNYGGRGITMQGSWKEDPHPFFDYVKSLPHYGEDGRSIDRLENNGNYEEGNLGWSTKREQATNQRLAKNNKTGYKGVSFYKPTGKYRATYHLNGKRKTKADFTTPLLAYLWRIEQIKLHKLVDYEEYHFTDEYINSLKNNQK